MYGCEQHSAGSAYGPVVVSREEGNTLSCSTKGVEFIEQMNNSYSPQNYAT
jgi:hypothetical protein